MEEGKDLAVFAHFGCRFQKTDGSIRQFKIFGIDHGNRGARGRRFRHEKDKIFAVGIRCRNDGIGRDGGAKTVAHQQIVGGKSGNCGDRMGRCWDVLEKCIGESCNLSVRSLW